MDETPRGNFKQFKPLSVSSDRHYRKNKPPRPGRSACQREFFDTLKSRRPEGAYF